MLAMARFCLQFLFIGCFLAFLHGIEASWSPAIDLALSEANNSLVIDNQQLDLLGVNLESPSLQVASDPFGNQVAVWLSEGVVYASSKPARSHWQTTVDRLSSLDETAQEFRLFVDSMGNAFAIWQSLPSGSIQTAVKLMGKQWQTETLTSRGERGIDPQIAASSDHSVIAIWKSREQENEKWRFAEYSLPTLKICSVDHQALTLLDQLEELPPFPHFKQFPPVGTLSTAICPQLPSVLPFPPRHLRGHQVENTFATQTDVINIITWDAAKEGPTPVAYHIYRDENLNKLAAIIPSNRKLKFKDHNRQLHHTYQYFIVAVDAAGNQSPPAGIAFEGNKTHLIKFKLPVSIAIQPIHSSLNLVVGSSEQFIATVTLSNGEVETLTNVNWCSSDPLVAAINANGVVTALAPGTTTITGSLGDVSSSVTVTVTSVPCPPPIITTTSLVGGTVGVPYFATISATGTAPITFALASGSLPPGLSLSSAGVISGTPTTAGDFDFTVQAKNACGTDIQDFSIPVCALPDITTTSLPSGIVGTAYSATINAMGSTPITFTLASGSLPPGLSLSSAGVISGTPTTAGTFSFTVRATNSCGTDTQALSITICQLPAITTTSLENAAEGFPYSATVNATGSTPITFSIVPGSGNLPSGLTLNSSTGEISGTPAAGTGSPEGTTYNFTVRASNACGSDDQPLSITVFTTS
jgi:hypothetical protein